MKKNQYKDGERDGHWEDYHSDGKLSAKTNYKNGKAHGLWELYQPNGKKVIKQFHL